MNSKGSGHGGAPAADQALVVTGAAGGIGRAIVAALMPRFSVTALIDLGLDDFEATAEGETLLYKADVRDAKAIGDAVSEVSARAPGGGVLVNCAGVILRKPTLETTVDEWTDLLAINLTGTFISSQAVIPWFRRAGGGGIINIGSIWATSVWPERAAYSASKAGVEQFTRVLAREVAEDGIRVNAVSPGLVATEFTESVVADQRFNDTFMPRLPIGRALTPMEVAGLVGWLASDASRPATGEIYGLHGGYY